MGACVGPLEGAEGCGKAGCGAGVGEGYPANGAAVVRGVAVVGRYDGLVGLLVAGAWGGEGRGTSAKPGDPAGGLPSG